MEDDTEVRPAPPPESVVALADPVVSSPRPDGGQEAKFRNRAVLPLCHDVVLGQGEKTGPEALECLERGYGAEGAELAAATPTVEGDMLVSYFRIMPGAAALQVFHDSTREKFGSGRWKESSCPLPEGHAGTRPAWAGPNSKPVLFTRKPPADSKLAYVVGGKHRSIGLFTGGSTNGPASTATGCSGRTVKDDSGA
jgi:hypothetical protein